MNVAIGSAGRSNVVRQCTAQPVVTVAHCVKRDLRKWFCFGSLLFGPRSDHCVHHIRICEGKSRICFVLLVVLCAQEDVYVSTVNTDTATLCEVIFSLAVAPKRQFLVRDMCCSGPQRCLSHMQFWRETCCLLFKAAPCVARDEWHNTRTPMEVFGMRLRMLTCFHCLLAR